MQRKKHSAEFKAKVALEAAKGLKTINEIASESEVHPTQVTLWKKQLLEEIPTLFASNRGQKQKTQEDLTATLYQQIGQLKVELDWVKKNLVLSVAEKKELVEPNHRSIPISRQCELLGLTRASFYYAAKPETEQNLRLMRMLDRQFTATPFYGVRRMTAWLATQGEAVNHKRVRRLMQNMGLEAIYPKPNLSKAKDNVRKYPYLLKEEEIRVPNQVWSTDITYIPLPQGYIYLIAVIDWYSRYVLSWELSNTMDITFCLSALDKALTQNTPKIFNTDQGSQFTSVAFTRRLEEKGITISQDGRGRALDNIFVERLWRSVKYEEVYPKAYTSVKEATQELEKYFHFYNHERLHQSLDYQTPATVHFKQP